MAEFLAHLTAAMLMGAGSTGAVAQATVEGETDPQRVDTPSGNDVVVTAPKREQRIEDGRSPSSR